MDALLFVLAMMYHSIHILTRSSKNDRCRVCVCVCVCARSLLENARKKINRNMWGKRKKKKKEKKRIPSRWVLVLFFRTVRPPPFARASHPSSPVTWYCHISITLYTSTNRDSVSFFFFSFSFSLFSCSWPTVEPSTYFAIVFLFFFFLPAIHFFFYSSDLSSHIFISFIYYTAHIYCICLLPSLNLRTLRTRGGEG